MRPFARLALTVSIVALGSAAVASAADAPIRPKAGLWKWTNPKPPEGHECPGPNCLSSTGQFRISRDRERVKAFTLTLNCASSPVSGTYKVMGTFPITKVTVKELGGTRWNVAKSRKGGWVTREATHDGVPGAKVNLQLVFKPSGRALQRNQAEVVTAQGDRCAPAPTQPVPAKPVR